MSKLYFILSIHNHQPVGNFDYVLEDAYRKSYLPFLERLSAHPMLKVVLHYSGNLLLWLEKRHPEAIDMISAFIKEGRAELLSGGFYEPVLSCLPEDDKVMQIAEMTEYIKDRFGYSPKGMWLAERVWEPHMPKYITRAGIEYLSVDDHHFKLAGLDDRELLGYYITEDEGHSIKVFPGSERLRYLIPFKDIYDVLNYFKEVSLVGGSPLLTMADDGEKFGVWPNTYKHCHEDGWLERFFSLLEENSDWLETTTFSEYQERFYPAGRVYLPTASYREMGEWTLPPESAVDYEYALTEMQRLFGEKAKAILRGGIWRSFFAKYPESNHIHKRMLMISNKVHKAVKGCSVRGVSRREEKSQKPTRYTLNAERYILHELWKGQCNDAYWHGIFGGLYLPHLRSSLYRHLLNAETMAEYILERFKSLKVQKFKGSIEEGDIDCDGFRDICVSSRNLTAFFTEESGSLIELSIKDKQINVLDTLTRRPEAYHSRITEVTNYELGETKTIHDRIIVKEAGLLNYLVYDNYRRASLLDHFFDYNIKLDDLIRSEYEEKGDFIGSPYSLDAINIKGNNGVRLFREGNASGSNVNIAKTILLRKAGMNVDYLLKGNYRGIFAIEFNLSLLGSPYASVYAGGRSLFLKDRGMHDSIDGFYVKDEFLKMKMVFSFDENIDLWHYPVETISLSEQGVEKIYQGTSFLFMKRLDFGDNKRLRFSIKFV
jgi:alpha-amylase